MNLTNLIQAFAERMDIVPPEPDDRGDYALTFDDALTVRFIPFTKGIVILRGVIGNIPDNEREAEDHLKKILTRNLSRMKAQKEVLSLEKDTNEVILYREVALEDMGADDFEEILEAFVNQLDAWGQAVSNSPEPPPNMFSFIIP